MMTKILHKRAKDDSRDCLKALEKLRSFQLRECTSYGSFKVLIYKKNRQNIIKISTKITTKNRHKRIIVSSKSFLERLGGLVRT